MVKTQDSLCGKACLTTTHSTRESQDTGPTLWAWHSPQMTSGVQRQVHPVTISPSRPGHSLTHNKIILTRYSFTYKITFIYYPGHSGSLEQVVHFATDQSTKREGSIGEASFPVTVLNIASLDHPSYFLGKCDYASLLNSELQWHSDSHRLVSLHLSSCREQLKHQLPGVQCSLAPFMPLSRLIIHLLPLSLFKTQCRHFPLQEASPDALYQYQIPLPCGSIEHYAQCQRA